MLFTLDAIVPGGISVPTRLLIAARIIREETAKVPIRKKDFVVYLIGIKLILPMLKCLDEPRKA